MARLDGRAAQRLIVMKVKSDVLYAGLTDKGRARPDNEDRIYMNGERGLFIVADGLGGHAAGERAAETAVEMIVARLERKTGTCEERMREAITVANNEIHALAQTRDDWKGMACVVSVALIEDGQVTVGHVGDSRLYLLEPGRIRKVTSDHSPVGELEDSGKLSEAAAMAHPRRNEVFRDLGSEPHTPNDEEFIEVLSFPFRPDNALLICSDGLSDQVPSEQIRNSIEGGAGDPKRAVRTLVDAANQVGGKDNVSAILVQGLEYAASRSSAAPVAAPPVPQWRKRSIPVLGFLLGSLLTLSAVALIRPYIIETAAGLRLAHGTVRQAITWNVSPGGSIAAALAKARPGDTVLVEPGTFRENLRLASGVAVRSARRHAAILESGGTSVLADSVQGALFEGFKLAGPGNSGVRIVNSDLQLTDVRITGMRQAAIDIEGESSAGIRANTITGNPGSGIVIGGTAHPLIVNNIITGNGKAPGALRPGLEITDAANPSVSGNVFADNGAEQVWASPLFNIEALLSGNFIAPGVKDRKTLVKVVTR